MGMESYAGLVTTCGPNESNYTTSAAMPLTMAPTGVKQSVKRIVGKEDIRHFLQTLGFCVGEDVTVVSEMGGNVIVNVKDTRIAINRSMASKILV